MTQMKTFFTVIVNFDVPDDNKDNAWIHAQNIEQMMYKHLDNCLQEQRASDDQHSTMTRFVIQAHNSTETIPSGHGSSLINLFGTTFDSMFKDWNNHIRHYATNLTTLSDECKNQIRTYGETNIYGNKVLPELTRDDLMKLWRNYRESVISAVSTILPNTLIEQVAKDLEGRYEDGLIDEPKPVDKANGKVEDLPTLTPEQSRRAQEEYDYNAHHTNLITVSTTNSEHPF